MMRKTVLTLLLALVVLNVIFVSGCLDGTKGPVASFHIEPPIAKINETIYFNSTSTDENGYIVNYTWFSDNGVIGYGPNITHRFFQYRTFKINLTVIDDQGNSGSSEQNLYIINTSLYDEKIVGYWTTFWRNQTGEMTYYQNHSLKTTWTGIAGASVTDWWKWQFNGSQLCFFESEDEFWDTGCLDFEFSDNYSSLTYFYEGESIEWKKGAEP